MAEVFDNRSVLLIDGDCLLCSKSARFIAHRDPEQRVAFGSVGSMAAERIMVEVRAAGMGVREPLPDSVILIQRDAAGRIRRFATKSDAVLGVAMLMRWPWSWLGFLGQILPRGWRDAAYDAVARRRIRWFGRAQGCALSAAGTMSNRIIKDGVIAATDASALRSTERRASAPVALSNK